MCVLSDSSDLFHPSVLSLRLRGEGEGFRDEDEGLTRVGKGRERGFRRRLKVVGALKSKLLYWWGRNWDVLVNGVHERMLV